MAVLFNFVLFRYKAKLLLNSETARILNTKQEILILFVITDEQFQILKKGFEIIFANKLNFEVRQ